MITEWTTPFIEAKAEYVAWLKTQEYPSYQSLLYRALQIVIEGKERSFLDPFPDPDRIHRIDDGGYQGTLVFVIAERDYQPSTYWYTTVSYGSCSGCDSLESAWGYGNNHNYEAMYTLALHMLQRAKKMDDGDYYGEKE